MLAKKYEHLKVEEGKYANWKDEYAENIHEQWAKLGLSLAYSKEQFTLDEGLSRAVNSIFNIKRKENVVC